MALANYIYTATSPDARNTLLHRHEANQSRIRNSDARQFRECATERMPLETLAGTAICKMVCKALSVTLFNAQQLSSEQTPAHASRAEGKLLRLAALCPDAPAIFSKQILELPLHCKQTDYMRCPTGKM